MVQVSGIAMEFWICTCAQLRQKFGQSTPRRGPLSLDEGFYNRPPSKFFFKIQQDPTSSSQNRQALVTRIRTTPVVLHISRHCCQLRRLTTTLASSWMLILASRLWSRRRVPSSLRSHLELLSHQSVVEGMVKALTAEKPEPERYLSVRACPALL